MRTRAPQPEAGGVYSSENANKGFMNKLSRIARTVGRTATNFLLGEPVEYKPRPTGFDPNRLLPPNAEDEQSRRLAQQYDHLTGDPALLPEGEPHRGQRRLIRGVSNTPDGKMYRMAVYDERARGWTGQRSIGATVAYETSFEDGTKGERRIDFQHFGDKVNTRTTDYVRYGDRVQVVNHNTGWATEVTGGTPMTEGQFAVLQEAMTAEQVAWSDPLVLEDI